MEKIKFSVLLSVYKNEKPEYLKQALESVVNQTIMPNEVVIVKDGPVTDDIEMVLNAYKQKYKDLFKVISFKKNRGLGLALRDGVMACKYEYVARMDTDDICKFNRFEKQIGYIKEHPYTALVGSWVKEFSVNPNITDTITKLPCGHEDIIKFAKSRNPFRHMTVIFHKAAILDSGNYRDFLWFEDYDLWVRVIQKGYKVANISEYLVDVRTGREMFARRGGWNYLKQEIRFQRFLYNEKFISSIQFAINIFIRSVVRLVPNCVREKFYTYILRKKYSFE